MNRMIKTLVSNKKRKCISSIFGYLEEDMTNWEKDLAYREEYEKMWNREVWEEKKKEAWEKRKLETSYLRVNKKSNVHVEIEYVFRAIEGAEKMTQEDFQEEIFNSLETVRLAQFGHCLGRFHAPFTQYRIKIFLETSHLFSFDCFSEKIESFFSNSLMNGMANFLLQRETKRTKIGTPGSLTFCEYCDSDYHFSYIFWGLINSKRIMKSIHTFYPSPKNSGSVGIP